MRWAAGPWVLGILQQWGAGEGVPGGCRTGNSAGKNPPE